MAAALTPGAALADQSGAAHGAEVQPAGIARLVDDRSILDRAEVTVPALPPAPAGKTYRAWLRSEDGTRYAFLGELKAPPADGGATPAATVTWDEPGAEDLLVQFTDVLVTLEQPGAAPAAPAANGMLVFQGKLDPGVVPQARRLLVRWGDSRFGTASLQALRRESDLARAQVAILNQAAATGDVATVRRKAEHLVNLVEGERGAYYGDVNRDGRVEDPGDGVGVIPYLWAALTQSQFAWTQAVDQQVADEALAIQPPLRYALDWAGFTRDMALKLAQTPDLTPGSPDATTTMADVRDSVAALATATRRLAAAIDPQDDPDLMQIAAQQGWSPAYDQAGTLAQMTLTQPCTFRLGFGDLYALIPGPVGLCLEDQRSAANGDALQLTTGGLLVWRKADNWTAFTDGYWTWINGPDGLVSRLNTERFPWESQ